MGPKEDKIHLGVKVKKIKRKRKRKKIIVKRKKMNEFVWIFENCVRICIVKEYMLLEWHAKCFGVGVFLVVY